MGVAQVVVYTGAILMMFLFVLMLIGVDSADSGHETLPGQRFVAVVGSLGMAAVLIAVVIATKVPETVGVMQNGNPDAASNPVEVAKLVFSNHVLTLELTGTLLIVAALGAMTLTHRDRVKPKVTQIELANQKVRDFTEKGIDPGQKPNPGVYAESNSSTNPSLTAYGKPLENSVNRVLKVRGQERRLAEISPATVAKITSGDLPSGPSTYGKVGRAHVNGMPGTSAPDHDGAFERFEALDSQPGSPALESSDSHKEEDNK